MKTYAEFDVIEIFNESGSFLAMLGIGWDNENLAVINFNKRVMNFKNRDMQIIFPLYSNEGRRYVKPVKEEFMGGWDNAYNISEDHIDAIVDGEIGWRSPIYASSDSKDALDNWKNRIHEVSIQICG